MSSIDIVTKHLIKQSPRVMQIQGMMDYSSEKTEHHVKIKNVDFKFDWGVGLIVGASGSGKTTIAKNIFGDSIFNYVWGDEALVDEFPKNISIKKITSSLTKVGLGSVPSWLRPYSTLSNGEKFRANMAMALVSDNDLIVIDEFTSVVDRTVAKIASNSVQKGFRESNKKLIAVSCHYDILEWLQPDWVIDLQDFTFRRRLRRDRPKLNIEIRDGTKKDWESLKHHHYMSGKIHPAAQMFSAFHDNRLMGFSSYIHFPHSKVKNIKMGHRAVIIPDYQGLGLGILMDDYIGEMLYKKGFRYRNRTSHPAMIKSYQKSKKWIVSSWGSTSSQTRKSTIHKSKNQKLKRIDLSRRVTASFEYRSLNA